MFNYVIWFALISTRGRKLDSPLLPQHFCTIASIFARLLQNKFVRGVWFPLSHRLEFQELAALSISSRFPRFQQPVLISFLDISNQLSNSFFRHSLYRYKADTTKMLQRSNMLGLHFLLFCSCSWLSCWAMDCS